MTARRDFLAANSGVRVPMPAFVLLVKPTGLGLVRSGFTVSKKVGSAVARNRAKRRLREVFRKHQGLVAPGLDLMLVARSAAVRWDFEVLAQKFQEACRRLPAQKSSAADAPDAKQ